MDIFLDRNVNKIGAEPNFITILLALLWSQKTS